MKNLFRRTFLKLLGILPFGMATLHLPTPEEKQKKAKKEGDCGCPVNLDEVR